MKIPLLAFSIPFLKWKLGSTAALFILTLGCSYIPWIIRSKVRNSKIIMSYLNCLTGGVVLGALLMHMLPEMGHTHLPSAHNHGHSHKHAADHHHQLSTTPHHPSLNSECCDGLHFGSHGACSGCTHAHHDHQPHEDKHGNTPKNQGIALQSNKSKLGHKAKKHKHGNHAHHGHFEIGYFAAGASFLVLLAIDRLLMHSHSHDHVHEWENGKKKQVNPMEEASPNLKHEPHHHHAKCGDIECPDRIRSDTPEEEDCASCHSEDLMGGCHMDSLDSKSSKTQALVFVLALSLHSFFEGLGMATKNSEKTLFFYLVSLFAHKWLEAFALGVNVMNAGFSDIYAFLLIFFYSILTPVGILIGMFFEQMTLESSYSMQAIQLLNGLAIGSFLFVSCIEIIPPEFHKKTRHTLPKFMLLSVGFAVMAGISALHSH